MTEIWEIRERYDEQVDGTCVSDGYSIYSGKELIAEAYTRDNADKIATVPEMLEALEALTNSFKGISEQSEPPQDWDCDDYPAYLQACAVVAKFNAPILED